MENYERIVKEIEEHNRLFELGLVTFKRKLMRYSDWNKKTKYKRLCGARLPPKPRASSNHAKVVKSWPKAPAECNRCEFPNPIKGKLIRST
jgi:hypothetical protein